MRSWGDIISGGQASSGSRGLSLLKCNVGMTPPPPSLGCHEAQKPRGSPGCGASELSPGPAVTEAGVHEVGGPCTGGGGQGEARLDGAGRSEQAPAADASPSGAG